MSKATRASLISWKPINNEILSAHFQHKFGKLSIIVTYVPTNISEEVINDEFYHALQNTLESISFHDVSVILMDVNTMPGLEARDSHMRSHTQALLSLKQLVMIWWATFRTVWQYWVLHWRHIWYSLDRITKKAIDHILIAQHWHSCILMQSFQRSWAWK